MGSDEKRIMAALLALVATILTSFLPILNKRILRDARPALVAWVVNAASLPLLALGTLLLTQCSLTLASRGVSFSCTTHLPHVDGIFVAALLASVALNFAATLLSIYALVQADASLVSPLLTFNPAFTLLVAWLTLGEAPGGRQTIGVGLVLVGAYLLEAEEARTGLLAPLHVLFHRAGAMLAVIASALWGVTTVLEKLSIEHMTPSSGPFVALVGTALMVVLLTPGRSSHRGERGPQPKKEVERTPGSSTRHDGSHCSRGHGPPLRLHCHRPGSGRVRHGALQAQFRPDHHLGLAISG